MSDRLTRILLFALVAAAIAFVAEPYIARYFLAAEQPRAITPRGDLTQTEQGTIELFRRVSPSVVHVFAEPRGRRIAPGGEASGTQTGTGFIWDAAGHVVTNNHVVEGANAVQIRLASGTVVPATIVGRAPNFDIAVLRLGRVASPPPPVAIGTSADLAVGQSAFAIGNPFGLDQTLTTGVISALQRRLPTNEGRELADVIQTDAASNPRNSAGPLLD
jgi:2-alkenal reductase